MPTAAPAPPPPFAGLDPDLVVDAVERLGLVSDGRVLALNSYENRVFRIGLEDAPAVVAKFYRPGRWSTAQVLEEHAFAHELAEGGLSVVAPLVVEGRTLHRYEGFDYALFPLQGGRAPDPGDRGTLRTLGRALGRLHAIGATRPFVHRPALDLASHGIAPVEALLEGGWLPEPLEDSFTTLADALLDACEAAFERAGDPPAIRVHGDFHLGNLLWREDRVHLVDLDDCAMAPPVQDLWMLLNGTPREREDQLGWLLEGYEPLHPFDPRSLHLVEPLRAMRLLHYHSWIARRWDDPAFKAAFPFFADVRHWEDVLRQMQEQLAALDEPVLRRR